MFNKFKSLMMMIIATLGLWFGVAMMDVVTSSDPGLIDFAAVMALLATVALWLVWGLANIENKPRETREKAKRKPAEDARLALLLELMDEDSRQRLQQRLADELSSDGEVVSLAQLLGAQKNQDSQRQ
jgi:hypothetical protein